jgi:SAM-dependent methyltransferase
MQDRKALELDKMREDWDRRARENARHYVATAKKKWSEEEYIRSGEINVQNEILTDMENVCQGMAPEEMRVLEIGCGTGRITRALAKVFGEVYGVDISGEMIRQAETTLRDFPNARVFQNNGRDLDVVRAALDGRAIDFAFSYIVFQHIPSRDVIESYVREVYSLLRPGALFKFQVQGHPENERRLDTWFGAYYNEEMARAMAERCGFEMRYNHGAGDQYYWLWFFKPPA